MTDEPATGEGSSPGRAGEAARQLIRCARQVIHDVLPEFYASKFKAATNSLPFKLLLIVEKLSIAFSDHVIVANHLWQERLVSRSVRPGKCTTFINYPDPSVFSRRPKVGPTGKFRIIYPGTLNAHQGLDDAIRAFAKVSSEMPTAEFHIYGEGPCKSSLIRLTEDLGLSGRVIFHDLVPIQKIAEFMAGADWVLFLSGRTPPSETRRQAQKSWSSCHWGFP